MKAVFLDRDGTIVEDRGYITIPDDLRILPGVPEAIVALKSRGWKVIVVSNQAAVARGLITEEELGEINFRMLTMLGAEGAVLDGVYVCPHHPDGKVPDYAIECGCRKPRSGLLDQAAVEHGLELSECVIIGDSLRDLEAGRAGGLRAGVLVLTGHGPKTASGDHGADFVASDLGAAARWVADL